MENIRPIYVVSGGKGIAGHTMVESLIIQYPEQKIPVMVFPNVQSEEKIIEVVELIKKNNGLCAHSMVNRNLRTILIQRCREELVPQIDFMGPLADFIEKEMGLESVNTPGLYRRINAKYFDRIEAMDFTLNNDDGLNPQRLKQAEIILIGVSRSGKTPLSVYMSMFGWKVANVPIVNGIQPPKELFEVDSDRVFALHIGRNQLIAQRESRLRQMGNISNQNYIDFKSVGEELAYFNIVVERGKFKKINVTGKPIESTANEIIGTISERYYREKGKYKSDVDGVE